MGEIINKWLQTGLLDSLLNEELKPILAIKFETLAIYLIENAGNYEEHVLTVAFAAMRRIYTQGKTIDDVSQFVRDLDNHFRSNRVRNMIQDLAGLDSNINIEAEMTTLFCEEYESDTKVKIEPIKWVKKHKLK